MLFSNLVRRLSLGTQRSKPIRKPVAARWFRPTIESLEDRLAPASTTTAVSAAPANGDVFGQAVTLTATVTPSAGTLSGGTVTFSDGVQNLGNGSFSGGVWTLNTTSLPGGPNQTITAVYSGTTSDSGSTGTLTNYTVAPASTTTTVSATPASGDIFGEAVTLSATVTSSAGMLNGGTVTFSDGAQNLGNGTFTGGVWTLTTTALPAGPNQTISALYSGAGDIYSGSTATLTNYTVAPASTITTVSATPAVLTVNTLLDTTYGGNYLSLRDAIATVDAGNTSALPAGEASQVAGTLGQNATIIFAAGLTGIMILSAALPPIMANVQILGPGAGQLTIDGTGQYEIMSSTAAQVSIAGLTFTEGNAVNGVDGDGGAIENGQSALMNISHCAFTGNVAAPGNFEGGAVSNLGSMTITGSTFIGNSAQVGGAVESDGTGLVLDNDTFSGNTSADEGGAVADYDTAAIQNSTFSGNKGNRGGAVFVEGSAAGELIVTGDSFTDNVALSGGGALYSRSPLTVAASTFAGNSATNDNGGAIDAYGPAVIVESTFAGNTCGFSGGGVCAEASATLQLTNDTFWGNSAANGDGSGVDVEAGAAATLDNTIVAGNYSSDNGLTDIGGFGTVNANSSNNLIGNDLTGTDGGLTNTNGNLIGVAPALLPLGNYGGPTETMPPAEGSPAIDAGNTAFVTDQETDERGFSRTSGSGVHVDIGAVEVQPAGVGTHLELQGPATATAGLPMSWTAVTLDDNGQPASTGFGPVIMDVVSGPASFTTTSTTLTNAVYGTANFNNLTLDTSGYYTLQASYGNSSITAPLVVDPITIAATSGTPQAAGVKGSFYPLVVTVDDADGNPIPNFGVTFNAPTFSPESFGGASGTFSNGSATITGTTNASGQLSESFTTGTVAGNYEVTASIVGVSNTSASFSLANLPGAPASIIGVGGSPLSTTVGTAFAAPFEVLVEDFYGNPVPFASVTFQAPASGASGTFSNGKATIMATTNASGEVSETITANAVAGSYAVTASATGVATPAPPFNLTNDLPATQVLLVSSATQMVMAGDALTPLTVKTEDKNGNPVPGTVTFTVTLAANRAGATFAGGLLTATVATSVVGGLDEAVVPTLTANGHLGPYTVVATVPGGTKSATFTVTNIADPVVGPSQSAVVNTKYATPLYAKVTDGVGNAIAGVIVTFTAPATGPSGTFSGLRTVSERTNAAGIATAPTFTANTRAGSFEVTVGFDGDAPPETIALTNLAGPPAHLTAVGGTPQSAVVNTGFATLLTVKVSDAYGNLLSQVPVTFTVQPGSSGAGATFAGSATATTTTTSTGKATAPVLTANGIKGAFKVRASVVENDEIFEAIFDLTNEIDSR